jgi:hypothetical protein
LTHDEQRTLVTLWAIFPSPLVIGGDLTQADLWTTSLLTNPEVLEVDQHSAGNHPVLVSDKTVIWMAESEDKRFHYVAAFNRSSEQSEAKYAWKELGLPAGAYQMRDLWGHKDEGTGSEFVVKLPARGCALFRLSG